MTKIIKRRSKATLIEYRIKYRHCGTTVRRTIQSEIPQYLIAREDKAIFHSACDHCSSQAIYGLVRCAGCQYFRSEWNKPDLREGNIWNKPNLNEDEELKDELCEMLDKTPDAVKKRWGII